VSNVAGQAYGFMAMTPILPARLPELRARLEGFSREDSPFAQLPRTHFARWVIVEDWVNDPDQRHDDHLGSPHLVFTSNLDGPLDSYLDELCELPEAAEIWGACVGCPPGAQGPGLKAYLLRHQIDTGFFVAAYPDASVATVRASLARRDRLIAFAIAAQGMEPAELQAAFDASFRD
jgi:hypothetical protein